MGTIRYGVGPDTKTKSAEVQELLRRIEQKKARLGIIGMGYVGLPLSRGFLGKGFQVVGFDVDGEKISALNQGRSYIKHISGDTIADFVRQGSFQPTNDYSRIGECDVLIICVPTPLGTHFEPNLDFVISSTREIAAHLRRGQLVVLESTTYPGTTEEVLLPILQQNGMKVGEDFHLGYSPEREDPGNRQFTTISIPKIVSGVTPGCTGLISVLYSQLMEKVVPVRSPKVAEAAKLLENIYRSVNIALVNELKLIFDTMGIDVWEVIEAARTKPFGFQAFFPGPGLGGHCIPIDPFYLTWKAREYGIHTRFIELSGEINSAMPAYVISVAVRALNSRNKALRNARVLLLGMAYKPDVDDMRESPSLKLLDLLLREGAYVDYNDPHIPMLPETRKYSFDMRSIDLTPRTLASYDLVIMATNHSAYDYAMISENARLIVDTRNVVPNLDGGQGKIWKA
jgi:UDP-N-acetyl-D-glucosamine dehydrogenase